MKFTSPPYQNVFFFLECSFFFPCIGAVCNPFSFQLLIWAFAFSDPKEKRNSPQEVKAAKTCPFPNSSRINFSTTSANYKVALRFFFWNLLSSALCFKFKSVYHRCKPKGRQIKFILQLYCNSNMVIDECNINYTVSYLVRRSSKRQLLLLLSTWKCEEWTWLTSTECCFLTSSRWDLSPPKRWWYHRSFSFASQPGYRQPAKRTWVSATCTLRAEDS